MNNPKVTIEMESGEKIELELLPEFAPNTVNNFISLIEKGFYNGLKFHRVIENFMIQGGDPNGTGTGGPGYGIKGEFSSNGFAQNTLSHQPGVISMARSRNPDSAGSQFFICDGDASFLNGDYAAFGKVTSGMDEVRRIARVKKDYSDMPNNPEIMKTVTVDTFGESYEPPKTLKGDR